MNIAREESSDQTTRASVRQSRKKSDIFDKHMKSYDQSKTLKTLNLIYSLIVGILTSRLTAKLPRSKLIGLIMALMSFMTSRKFLQIEQHKE